MKLQSYEYICLYLTSIYILKYRHSSNNHINVSACALAMCILTYMHIHIQG